jgi:hypothetical protein
MEIMVSLLILRSKEERENIWKSDSKDCLV